MTERIGRRTWAKRAFSLAQAFTPGNAAVCRAGTACLAASSGTRGATRRRRGMVLVIVTVVVAIISLAGLAFVTTMHAEGKAVRVQGEQIQLEHVVGSGAELLKAVLGQSWEAQREAGGVWDNPRLFRAVVVVEDEETGRRVRCSVVAPSGGGDGRSASIRFGVENESARLNLGVLLQWEQREPGSAHRALMSLPEMTDAIADAILDWLDPDSSPRQFGAEADYYRGLGVPYAPRNGVPQCLEELLLIRGVTRPLLFGPEGSLDLPSQPRGRQAAERLRVGAFSSSPPWASLVTVSSAERNRTADGRPRIDLNQDKLALLHQQLLEAFEPRWADFVVLYRQHGPYSGSRAGDPSGPPLDLTLPAKVRLESVLDLIDAKVQIPAAAGRTSPVVASPFASDPAALRQDLPKLMDRTSTESDAVIYGRVNVNAAAREVLRAVPGLDGAAVEQIVAARGLAAGPEPADRRHATWLLAEGLVDLSRMKALLPYLTGGGDVARAQSSPSSTRRGRRFGPRR